MNILINPETGHVTSMVDGPGSRVLPFGFPLWDLEDILKYMESEGCH